MELEILEAFREKILRGEMKGDLKQVEKEIKEIKRKHFLVFLWAFTPGWIAILYAIAYLLSKT